jgi:hypothetical protein
MNDIAVSAESQLSTSEQSELGPLCDEVDNYCSSFHAAGIALRRIRDGRLYRGASQTFEAFVSARFGFGKSHAYRLIAAADTMAALSGSCQYLPAHEAICRELNRIPDEPKRLQLWKRISEKAAKDGKIVTAMIIEVAVGKIVEPPKKKRKAKAAEPATTIVAEPPAEAKDATPATPAENPNGGDILEELEDSAADPDEQPAVEEPVPGDFSEQKAAAAQATRELLDSVCPKILTYSLRVDRFLRAVGEDGIDTDLIDDCMSKIHAQLELAERRCRS